LNYEESAFRLSLIAYINYIQRKIRRNADFEPYPLVKAIYCALEGMRDNPVGANLMGISGDAQNHEDDKPRDAYCVILRKDDDQTFTLLNVHDLLIGRDVPTEAAMHLLLLSMNLDKYEGPNVPVDAATDILNSTIPKFEVVRFNNSEWKDARDSFVETIKQGKIQFPKVLETDRLIKDFLSIQTNTPWEDYPPSVRTSIAQDWIFKKLKPQSGKTLIVLSSIDNIIQKYKVMNMAKQFLFGEPSDFFGKNTDEGLEKTSKDLKEKTIGRNDHCPCGSGKKYKKCCGLSS